MADDTIPWSPNRPFRREDIATHAPRTSGIYRILDRDGTLVYIGRSLSSIRTRLLDHWEGRGRGNKYIARLRAVEEATRGDLGFSFGFYACDPQSAKSLEGIRTEIGNGILNSRTESSWETVELDDGTLVQVKHQNAHFH